MLSTSGVFIVVMIQGKKSFKKV